MKEDKIFDREIRDLFYDAEEKVPRRVWDTVSSRIAGSGSGWWPVVGLAFASFAIALSIPFLFMPAESVEETVCKDGYYSNVEVRKVEEDRLPTLLAKAERPDIGPETETELPDTAPAREAEDKSGSGRKSAAEADRPVREAARPDPFAQTESISKASRHPRLFVSGTVCGGEGNSQSIPKRSGGTPGISDKDEFTETGQSTYGLPFTIGLGVRIPLGKRLSLDTGIDYSLLTRTYECSLTPAGTTDMIQGSGASTLHYLGVPLKLNCSIIKTDAIDFYALAGAEAEFCVAGKFEYKGPGKSITGKEDCGSPLFSVGIGLGVEFKITKWLGIYIDPEVNYFIPGNHPKSIRTDKPLMFNLGAGLRFNL